jgi:hypothetical protein
MWKQETKQTDAQCGSNIKSIQARAEKGGKNKRIEERNQNDRVGRTPVQHIVHGKSKKAAVV